MRRIGQFLVIVALVSAGTPASREATTGLRASEGQPASHQPSALPPAVWRGHPFPGGGTILFRVQQAPGYEVTAIGLVSADGSVQELPSSDQSFAYWDPRKGSRGLIIVEADRNPVIRAYTLNGERATPSGRWSTDDGLFATFSRDGRWIADLSFDRRGRLQTSEVIVTHRATGASRTLRLGGDLTVTGWSPDGRLLASPWSGGRSVLVDPRTGQLERLADRRANVGWGSLVTWSPTDDAFAAALWGKRRSAIAIFDREGRLLRRVPVGSRNVSLPTWSPDGTRVAYIVRGPEPDGHRRASLVMFDLSTDRRETVRRGISDAFWASWSPDGRWLLIDDWAHHRWLFVAADGSGVVTYPWLGGMPRWCCPASPGIEVRYPVC